MPVKIDFNCHLRLTSENIASILHSLKLAHHFHFQGTCWNDAAVCEIISTEVNLVCLVCPAILFTELR